ncbi:MAG TPA: YfiR family protein [Bryobacteraceae bacterium]|nr:YfiR family protein [Bryobacteraceae bacterium]
MSWPMERALRLLLAGAAVACCAAEPPEASLELQVKVAFVYNFAKFVEWPGPGSSSDDSLSFCVIGVEPLYDELKQSVRGKTIAGRPVIVRRSENRAVDQHCNVVFIGGDKEHFADILEAATASGALTVSDCERFAERGGMIQLIKDENKFRFAINVEAVSRSGLRISAKLLQLSSKAPAQLARSKP